MWIYYVRKSEKKNGWMEKQCRCRCEFGTRKWTNESCIRHANRNRNKKWIICCHVKELDKIYTTTARQHGYSMWTVTGIHHKVYVGIYGVLCMPINNIQFTSVYYPYSIFSISNSICIWRWLTGVVGLITCSFQSIFIFLMILFSGHHYDSFRTIIFGNVPS